ncbi:beta-propeller domain-containing protein [Haloplasma contractile]|nr:beta-propeller domain-containing protein [Haloplasma contractile]
MFWFLFIILIIASVIGGIYLLIKELDTIKRYSYIGNSKAILYMGTSIAVIMLIALVVITKPFGNKELSLVENVQSKNRLLHIINTFNSEVNQDQIDETTKKLTNMQPAILEEDYYSVYKSKEDGMEESDIVKKKGHYLYSLSKDRVIITNVNSVRQTRVVKEISYENEKFIPKSIYIYNNRLIVLGHAYDVKQSRSQDQVEINRSIYDKESEQYKEITSTRVYVYDSDFEIKDRYEADGILLRTRIVNDTLYLITGDAVNVKELTEDSIDLRPSYKVNNKEHKIRYRNIKYFKGSKPESFIIVSGISLEDDYKKMEAFAYLGEGEYFYISQDNIYIIEHRYNYSMKKNNITTLVSRLKIDGDRIDYIKTKELAGYIANEYALDEYHEYLRIATTIGHHNEDESYNNLYVLDLSLTIVGELTEIAKGERIQSTRFVNDKVYMSTFRVVDPFFIIDLSNPKNPSIVGKLKTLGYSAYIKPYDDHHLISFGYESDEYGNILGLKIALFDISNQVDPKQLDKIFIPYEQFGNVYSEVTFNASALMFDPERNLLGFPISWWDKKVDYIIDETGHAVEINDYINKQAYFIYNMDSNIGFRKIGFITHKITKEEGIDEQDYIKRSVIINDHLYAVSESTIEIYDLDDVKKIKEINLI